MVEDPNVTGLVTEARNCPAAGDDKKAASLLTDAAYGTHDPEIEQQVRRSRRTGARARRSVRQGTLEEDHPHSRPSHPTRVTL